MAKGQSLQDPFLNALRKERVPVSIYLVNGIKLQGQIDSFDQFVVLLKNSVSQMVYKHAISTVVPARNVRLTEEGVAVATRIRAARLEALDSLLDGLEPAARDQLDALLAQTLGATTGDRDAARHICRLCDPGVCGHPERCPVTVAADAAASA